MKWYRRLLKYPELWVLTGVALVTRLWQLQLPPAIVFDEVYFRQFAGNYLDGHYFFDIHPPLVKLLFAGMANIFHLDAAQLTGGDPAATALRVLPALAGLLLVPLIYVIIRQFGLGRRVATLGALLLLLDNALLVESRFILMDSLLLLFGFGALSSYLVLRKAKGIKRWVWTVITALLIGCLVTTKWSGLAMAGLIGVLWLIDWPRQRKVLAKQWPRMAGEAAVAVVIVAAIYIGSFMLHFAYLTKSGEGDAFMSQKFQSLLVGSATYDKNARMSFWSKFVELNEEMYTAQNTLKGVEHPYASKWYSWPLEIRPVYYWQGEVVKERQAHVYLLGNPVVWWGSAIAVVIVLLAWLGKPKLLGMRRRLVAFLLAGYAVNFIPFAFIDRPMFLYHYFFALFFAVLIICVLLAILFDWQRQKYGRKAVTQTSWAIAIVTLLGFLYFLPISYGWPLMTSDLMQRMWLPTWR